MRSRALWRGIAVIALALTAAGVAAGSAERARAADPPSFRLLTADRNVKLTGHRNRVRLDGLGAFVGTRGGELRIDVTRPAYRRWRGAQVDAETGEVLRPIPARLLGERAGLERFLRVDLAKPGGELVARRVASFCPNAGWRERTDDSGPVDTRYPGGCGGGFPFLRGKVWGIDAGWAVRSRLGRVRVAPGRYRATVRIRARYRRLFEIPAADARRTVAVRVVRPRRRHRRPRAVPAAGPAELRARSESPERLAAPLIDDPDPATVPDLAALPAWSIRAHRRGRRDLLGFATSPWNAGPAPLVIEGYRGEGKRDLMDAYQYFFDSDGEVVGKAPAGTMVYHRRRGHFHWHLDQFARFTLVKVGGGRRVRSHKQSYCIMPTDAVDLTVPGAEWMPWLHRGSACGGQGSIWIRQSLPAGWADTYFQNVAGQAFNITKVPNGRYRIRVEVNPHGELHEVTAANNVAERIVRLRGPRGARRAVVRPWNGIRR